MQYKVNTIPHRDIETRWQQFWHETKQDIVDIDNAKKPYFNLMMFPYPSAEGLHVGNMYAFTGADIYGRYMRMQGYDVFEPIGLDGFGIHSENFALKIGRHPKDHAAISEKNFYKQLHTIGAMFDWSRTVETYNPNYYRWTQWIFTKMFEKGLAYRGKAPVTWCGSCKTVLSDEQVLVDVCERCGNKIEKKLMEQWFFRITAYAGKLLENLPALKWSEKVKVAQQNWIGQSIGVNFKEKVKDLDIEIEVFDTVPQTFLAQTFTVIAPEHPLVKQLVSGTKYEKPVMEFVKRMKKKRLKNAKMDHEIEGIFTGRYIDNPFGTGDLPIWIASFVVADYGTGIVNCSAHDERDFAFAKKYDIPLKYSMLPPDQKIAEKIRNFELCYHHTPEGIMQTPKEICGMKWSDARDAIIFYIEQKGYGKRATHYHLRDWTISRQRYWGAPIPMIYCETCKWVAVPEKDLPVLLPDIADYKPRDDGVGPLAKHKEFYETTCPHCGAPARRETDVCDTFLDSSWYHLRYPSTLRQLADRSGQVPFDPEITKKWLPVAMYTGGAEHSVLHLMYARFIAMALHDMGYIDFDEPYTNFFAHGLVIKDGAKMSKSKGNVVNPDEYIKKFGADALRMYLMFMGPFFEGGDFRDTGMEGMYRFLGRVWRLVIASANMKAVDNDALIHRHLQRAIQRATDDLPKRRYNTTIAGYMEFVNSAIDAKKPLGIEDAKNFIKLLAPFAPHVAEEMWFRLGGAKIDDYVSVHKLPWPMYDKGLLVDSSIQFVAQVNGKIRETLTVTPQQGKDQQVIEELAKNSDRLKKYLTTRPQKIIFISGKLINFVV